MDIKFPDPINKTGTQSTGSGETIYTSGDVSVYNCHYIECILGTVTVSVSIDAGANYIGGVAVRDVQSATPSTFVLTITAGKIGELRGCFSNIKVVESGGVAANARIRHGNV